MKSWIMRQDVARCSELSYREVRDDAEVTHVMRCNRISELKGSGTDQQIADRNAHAFCLEAAIDPASAQRDRRCNRFHRDFAK